MVTHFKILSCYHFANEFRKKFQHIILEENFNFDCFCDNTYGSLGLFVCVCDISVEKSCICHDKKKHCCVQCVLNTLNYRLTKFSFLYRNCDDIFHVYKVLLLSCYLKYLKGDFKYNYSVFYKKIFARSVDS